MPLININLLPKHLRRVREPRYWAAVAVLFPLVVLGVLGFIQFTLSQTISNREDEIITLEAQRLALQPFINQQRELTARLQQLQELDAIQMEVEANRILWTGEITALLEFLPPQGEAVRPRIDFQNLTMTAVNPPGSDPNRYEGRPFIAEMNVTGKAVSTQVLAEFIRSLESSNTFGINFQNASREEDTGFYNYSLTIGALSGRGE